MNSNDTDTPNDSDKPAAEASAEGAAPKRKRAPARPKATEVAAAPSGDMPAEAAEPAVKKPRAPRKTTAAKSEAAAAESPPIEAPAAEAAEETAPKRRAPRKTTKVADAAAETVAETKAAPAAAEQVPLFTLAPEPAERAATDGDAPREAAASDAGGAGDDAAGEERSGRNRNRRRGRKDRAERGEGGDGGQTAPAVQAVEPAPEVVAAAGERFADVVGGAFDGVADAPADVEAEIGAEEAGEVDTKRVLAPEPDAPKLQKVLAQAGVGSRRDIEDMIGEGKIEVNGEVAHIGQRISFGDRVHVNGKPIKVRITPPAPRILAYHKPTGEVVTFNDPEGRPTVFRHLPKLHQGKWQSVGRLDLNTEGLLLFTNSGELANQLMHPRFGVEREYAVRVLGSLTPDQRARLLEGVMVEGQKASFKSIEDGGGEGVNHWYRVVITEGRNREVRKLFDTVGLTVSRLIRIRYGTVVLPRGLKRGVWVELGEDDVRIIRRLAGYDQQRAQQRAERGEDGGRNERGDRGEAGKGNRNKRRADGRQAGVGPRPSRPEPRQERPDRPERDRFNEQPRGQDRERPERDDEDHDDFIPRNINPLEQTFDRRFATSGKRGIPQGFGAGGSGQGHGHGGGQQGRGGNKGGGPREPDPMQTSVGYIGADAFQRRGGRGGGGNRGGGGGNRGGGGGRSGGGFGGRHR